MRLDIITLFPELIESPFNASIIKRAKEELSKEIKIKILLSLDTKLNHLLYTAEEA